MYRMPLVVTLSLIAVVSVVACEGTEAGPESSSQPQAAPQARPRVLPSLAKAKLTEATAAAKQWKADAVLIQIVGRDIGEDGMTILWDYGFYAASAKTCLVVNVGGAGATKQESGGATCESPELTEFMDSDQAIKIARSNGITNPKATMVVSASARGKGATWSVMDERGMKPGNVMLDVDAVTGKVLNKTTQR